MRPAYVYRRRRLGALVVMMAAAWALYTGASADAEASPTYHTVAPGDTLWSITEDHYPLSVDPRPVVAEIRSANDLDGAEIYPGMRLELP